MGLPGHIFVALMIEIASLMLVMFGVFVGVEEADPVSTFLTEL